MNAKKYEIIVTLLLAGAMVHSVRADSVQTLLRQGNNLYDQGNFNEAIDKYDQALLEKPQAPEPKFNKANSYYRLDDLAEAMDLYSRVAADSKDMKLVTKAKYNLGNAYFQQGLKQRDSDLQKAIDDLKTSITYWRGALDINPKNVKPARNIEVARLIIKDILDQLNKQQQQQDPNQPQDPNQAQQQQSQQGQDRNQNQAGRQPQDPNQPHDPNQAKDPNQTDNQQTQEQQTIAPDATAQEILDNEQRQKQQRQILQTGQYQPVKKDW